MVGNWNPGVSKFNDPIPSVCVQMLRNYPDYPKTASGKNPRILIDVILFNLFLM